MYIDIVLQYLQSSGERRAERDFHEMTLDISQKEFNKLKKPYLNFTSFFHHLLCFEIFWRSGDLIFSSDASRCAQSLLLRSRFPQWRRRKERAIFFNVLIHFSKTDFKTLQKPYGNFSSFFQHLVLLEKYWRLEELILSPNASRDATLYVLSNEDLMYVRGGRGLSISDPGFPNDRSPELRPLPQLADLPSTLLPRAVPCTSLHDALSTGADLLHPPSANTSSSTASAVNTQAQHEALPSATLNKDLAPNSVTANAEALHPLRPPQHTPNWTHHMTTQSTSKEPQLLRFFTQLQEELLQNGTSVAGKAVSTSPFSAIPSNSSIVASAVHTLPAAQSDNTLSPSTMSLPNIVLAANGQAPNAFQTNQETTSVLRQTGGIIQLNTGAHQELQANDGSQKMGSTVDLLPRIENVWSLNAKERKELWGDSDVEESLVPQGKNSSGTEPKELHINIIKKSSPRIVNTSTTQVATLSKPITLIMPSGVYILRDSQSSQ